MARTFTIFTVWHCTIVDIDANACSDGLEVCSEVIPNSLFISSYQAWDLCILVARDVCCCRAFGRLGSACQVAGDEEALRASGITHIVNTAADVCSELSTGDSMRQ